MGKDQTGLLYFFLRAVKDLGEDGDLSRWRSMRADGGDSGRRAWGGYRRSVLKISPRVADSQGLIRFFVFKPQLNSRYCSFKRCPSVGSQGGMPGPAMR